MPREISIFSDYHQKENSLTNYCGILFRLIYRESPQQFETLVASFLPEEAQISVGPIFTQQEKHQKSVPDLLVRQEAFNLFFETKIDDWFYDEQLERHLIALGALSGVKVLFCLSNFETANPEARFASLVNQAKEKSIVVQFISFEDLLQQVRALRLSNSLLETVDEFDVYLDRNGLLPRWRYLLDVVNCGDTMDEIEAGAYVCPNKSGPYTHAHARFLGAYKLKTVRSIHEIDALVVCTPGGTDFEVRWKNNGQTDACLKERARAMLEKLNPIHSTLQSDGLQIFLLGSYAKTNFVKDTRGGLFGSRRYFWDIAKIVEAETAPQLAQKLNGRTWSEFAR